jgi:hypothetical protein
MCVSWFGCCCGGSLNLKKNEEDSASNLIIQQTVVMNVFILSSSWELHIGSKKFLRNTAALKTLIFSQSMGQVHPTKRAKNTNSTLHSGTLLATSHHMGQRAIQIPLSIMH